MADSLLTTKYRDLAREGHSLSLELERGQASTPLADHFAALTDEQAREPFTLTLLSLDAKARADALAWLLGEDHRTVSLRAGALPGLAEIHLSDRGYWLEERGGQRREFDSLQGFLGALESQTPIAVAPEWEGVTVSLAAPPGTQGARLLLPESLQALREVPGLSGRLITRTQILLVAGSAGLKPEGEDANDIAHLAQGIGVLLPVQVEGETSRPPAPWWRELPATGLLTLSPVRLGAQNPASAFAGPFDELRETLGLSTHARRLQLAVEALRERHEQELRQAQARRTREERTARPDSTTPDPNARRPFELAKIRAQEELAALGKATVESSRRSLLPDGALTRALQEQLQSLRAEDLVQEPGAKTVKLSLSPEFQTHLQRALRKAMKDELARDLVTQRDGAAALRQELEKNLESAEHGPVTLALSPPSESDIWPRLSELVSVELRYRGEMPKRGFVQRLGEGRRMVFAVMMILSLVGSMVGFSWRGIGIIGIAFLLLFLGVVFYTYRAWKREDAEKLDAELDRVRDQLQMECKRLATDVQREKQSRIAEYLDQTKRALLLRIDDLQRERLQREQEQTGEARERARARLRKLDQQAKELQNHTSRLSKLRQDGNNLVADVQRSLRDTANKLRLTGGA